MGAMEQMLANMVGITPTEMREMAERIQTGFLELAATVKRIEEKQDLILEQFGKDSVEVLEIEDAGRKSGASDSADASAGAGN